MEAIREKSIHRGEIHPRITDIPRSEVIQRKTVIIIIIITPIILPLIIPIIAIELFNIVIVLRYNGFVLSSPFSFF